LVQHESTQTWTNSVDSDYGLCVPRTRGIGAVAFANANRDDFLLSRRLVDLDMHMMDWFK
jgi:hypothetical protein